MLQYRAMTIIYKSSEQIYLSRYNTESKITFGLYIMTIVHAGIDMETIIRLILIFVLKNGYLCYTDTRKKITCFIILKENYGNIKN
jgi:hypothetical protein